MAEPIRISRQEIGIAAVRVPAWFWFESRGSGAQ